MTEAQKASRRTWLDRALDGEFDGANLGRAFVNEYIGPAKAALGDDPVAWDSPDGLRFCEFFGMTPADMGVAFTLAYPSLSPIGVAYVVERYREERRLQSIVDAMTGTSGAA